MNDQQVVFEQFQNDYHIIFPNMIHASGGLPDTKGPGISDVDVVIEREDFADLGKYFTTQTKIEADINDNRAIYRIHGYPRIIEVYSRKKDDGRAVKHALTELALAKQYADLAVIAWHLKKYMDITTEEAWGKVLELEDDPYEVLLDMEVTLKNADKAAARIGEISKMLYYL